MLCSCLTIIVGLVHIEWNCIVLRTTIPNNGRTAPMNVAPQDNNPIELPLLKLFQTVPELDQDESTDEEVASSFPNHHFFAGTPILDDGPV